MRHILRNVQSSEPTAFVNAVHSFFENDLFHPNRTYWKESIKPQITSRFIDGLSEEELSLSYDLSQNFNNSLFQGLIDLISEDSGVRIRTVHLEAIAQSFLAKKDVHVDKSQIYFRTKIKPMNFVLQDEAFALIQTAIRQFGSQDADGMLSKARNLYEACLKVKPDDFKSFCNWGIAEMEYSKLLIGSAEMSYKFALSRFSESLKIKPDYMEALGNWGICQYFRQTKSNLDIPIKRGMLISAGNALAKCLESCGANSEFFKFFFYLGLVYIQYAHFLKQYSETINTLPSELPEPFQNLGDSLKMNEMGITKCLDLAYDAFHAALKLNGEDIPTRLELVRVLMEKINLYSSANEPNSNQIQIDLYLEATNYLNQALTIE